MLERLRRIVTGDNGRGRSVVVIDGPPGNAVGAGTTGLAEMWETRGAAVDPRDHGDAVPPAFTLRPPAGGSKFFFVAVAPLDPAATLDELEAQAAAGFAAMGAADARVDTTRHPRMHKTATVDYIILLRGRVTLLLDEDERELEPFDVVVQRGTNHAWINRGREPALLAAVLIDAEIAPGDGDA